MTEKHGFTGDHLLWHDSKDKRRFAARPTYSLAPPPFSPVGSRTRTARKNEHTFNRERELAAWAARENDPEIIDSIGVSETILLAEQRFIQLAHTYLDHWSQDGHGKYEQFEVWLNAVADLTSREIAQLWTSRGDWFHRVCLAKLRESLKPRISEWTKKARDWEMKRLTAQPMPTSGAIPAQYSADEFELTMKAGQSALTRAKWLADHELMQEPSSVAASQHSEPTPERQGDAQHSESTPERQVEALKKQRRAERNSYKDECRARGIAVTDEMIAKAANPRWHGRSIIQKWIQCHPSFEGGADKAIRRVFREKPHLKITPK